MIVRINPQYSAFAPRIEALPAQFSSEGVSLHQGRNQVRAMRWGDLDVIVKRYKKPNIFLKLQFALLNTCKAKKAYKYGCLFNEAGISTPTPIAYVIDGRWPMFKDSYFVSLPVSGTCLNDTLTVEDDNMINRLASEAARMHDAGLMHGDLNLTNIYADADGSLHFIDTNRTKARRKITPKTCAENLMRLTSDRPLLSKIARSYAQIRGWDADAFSALVLARLEAFLRKKALLNRLKKLFKKK